MKKSIWITLFLAIASMAFVSCGKDDDEAPLNPDQLVGSYTSVINGKLTVKILGQTVTQDIPTTNDKFTIEEVEDKLLVTWEDGTSIYYTVSGSKMTGSTQYTASEDDIDMTGTISSTGYMSGSNLIFEHKLTGTAKSTGISGTFTGEIKETATKKL